ncbi:NADPH:quinone reductase [Microvirga massiliensis]|uniref:NADPH:quinone reductase n=1 Tax=Microvirga massiliensis TaxID=1033741 RepID=UPI00062BC2F4|nr:NADPH:quinone reductase [Microvirga massiliensis]
MRTAWYERNGPAQDVLQVGTMETPEPGPGEVRVRVQASGVNPSDWKTRSGSRPMVAPRVIPHSDGAGVIDRIGPGVTDRRLGERVWLWNGQWRRPYGTAAEYIVLPAAQAVPLPENTSFAEGACLGIPALTAHRAVTTDRPCSGEIVLVTGGAGAVGHYAIQFAKLLGAAQVIATVSSAEKAEHAREAGADAIIDYRTEHVVERVQALTNGHGADRIVEVDISGNAHLLPQIVARDGLCVAYGSNGPDATFTFGPMILTGAAVRFFIVYELSAEARRIGIEDLTRWLQAGAMTHRVAAEFPLERIAEAHEAVEQGRFIGNVVVIP